MLEKEGMSGGGVRMKSSWGVGGWGGRTLLYRSKNDRGEGGSKVWSGEGK